jgi:ABC-type sugar transport system substrate-binding protein
MMKKLGRAVLLFSACVGLAFAQTPAPAAKSPRVSQTVKQLEHDWVDAMKAGDLGSSEEESTETFRNADLSEVRLSVPCQRTDLRHAQLRTHRRLIVLATQPAPNPLSMLTTETFEAQLFSIPRSAVNPPKLAP